MAAQIFVHAAFAVAFSLLGGCASPLDHDSRPSDPRTVGAPDAEAFPPRSVFREGEAAESSAGPSGGAPLNADSVPDDYIRYALHHSPRVEAAYQRWLAASERLGQVGSLPDPRLSVGFFLDEVETRVGPQQARVGLSQSFPWPGVLEGRTDAAAAAARASWQGVVGARLEVTERVVAALHELAYLDAAVRITRENLELLSSFEGVVRTRYKVGTGSHPELIRVQVELGQVEDRLAQLESMRGVYEAELNAAMNRPSQSGVPELGALPGRVATLDAVSLAEMAARTSPVLLALDERTEEQRLLTGVARREGLPGFTAGLDYIVTGDAMNPNTPESGDDPVLLSLGLTIPLWRDRYDAGVRESIARRLALSHDRADEANRIAAAIQRAWFEHTDAGRRVRLYERTLIPKAEESLRASLAGFRTGETSFLDLLDTERSLLEFAVAAERARADRGRALAHLNRLVGQPVPTEPAEPTDPGDQDHQEEAP